MVRKLVLCSLCNPHSLRRRRAAPRRRSPGVCAHAGDGEGGGARCSAQGGEGDAGACGAQTPRFLTWSRAEGDAGGGCAWAPGMSCSPCFRNMNWTQCRGNSGRNWASGCRTQDMKLVQLVLHFLKPRAAYRTHWWEVQDLGRWEEPEGVI